MKTETGKLRTANIANSGAIETEWLYKAVADKRDRYLSPSLRTFTAYDQPLLLQKGDRQYLWDEHGKRYLDCLGQNLTVSVGHSHPLVMAEVRKQLDSLQHCTTMYYHPVPGHFAEELVQKMPVGEDWVVHFVNSGAEAIDLAMLVARLYTKNFEIISLRHAYHGLHFGAMSVTGMEACRQPVPMASGVIHVHNPDQYRGMHGATVDPYVEEIGRTIESSTPGKVAGFLVEPIQGYGGVLPVPLGYLSGAFERVRAAGGVCIVDEVQTGFARMGSHYWGFEVHGVIPDIVVMGKGISNGFPLSAVVMKRAIAESMTEKRFFNTYGANPVACAAGRAVLRIIDEEELQENANRVGEQMLNGLQQLQAKYDIIGDVRGRGLMIGVELVKDRATKKPATAETGRVFEVTKNVGLIMGRSGIHKNVLRISPPLCIQSEDVKFFLEGMDSSLGSL